jgi:hypothetical protein
VGIGPTLAVFTIVVQNAVPFEKLGTATSNLTFFRQIGGSVGLAIAGTVFATSLRDTLPGQLIPVMQQVRAQLPSQLQAQFDGLGSTLQSAGANLNVNNLTGVGQSFGRAVVDFAIAHVPGQAAPLVKQLLEPFIPQLDAAFHQAFSLAVGTTFVVGAASTIVALTASATLREEPLRRTMESPVAAADEAPEEARGPALT